MKPSLYEKGGEGAVESLRRCLQHAWGFSLIQDALSLCLMVALLCFSYRSSASAGTWICFIPFLQKAYNNPFPLSTRCILIVPNLVV